MKSILVSIVAAVVLVACASKPEYSGSYSLTVEGGTIRFQLKSDGSFIGSPEGVNDDVVGTWKIEGDLLVCEGTTTEDSIQITVKFDKTTFKLISFANNGEEAPLDEMIPEGENGIYLRKSQQSAPAPETKPEPPTAGAPDISIHQAVMLENVEVVKKHLAAGTDVNARGEDVGTPPLHIAALVGSNEIVELLITKGADVNAKEEEEGWTPLFVAVGEGYKKIIELLIANGADVNAKDDVGDTPLDMAIGLEQPETVDLLRKHGGKTGEALKAKGK